jgi:hypothetical protein
MNSLKKFMIYIMSLSILLTRLEAPMNDAQTSQFKKTLLGVVGSHQYLILAKGNIGDVVEFKELYMPLQIWYSFLSK